MITVRFVVVALVLGSIACAGEGPLLLGTLSEPALIGFAFSLDGQSLIAATGEGLEFWDLTTGERTHFLPISGIRAFALHAESGLAALGFASAVEIWDISTRTRLLVLPYGAITVYPHLAFSPSGRVLAADVGSKLLLWDTRTGKMLSSGDGALEAPAFLSDTEVVQPLYPNVVLWNFVSGQSVVLGKMDARGKVIVDPTRRIIGYPVKSAYRFVNVDTRETLLEVRTTGSSKSWVGILPTGELLLPAHLPGSRDGLYIFDGGSGAPRCCLTCFSKTAIPEKVAISPDGTKVAVHELPEETISHVSVYDVTTCQLVASVGKWSAGTEVAKPALEGRYIVRGSRNRVEVWDMNQGLLIRDIQVRALGDLAVSPVAPVIAAGQLFGSEILVWNWETGATWLINLQLSDPQASFANRASRLAFLPEGNALLVIHNNGALSRWDWASGKLVWATKEGQAGEALAISPRGDLAATAGAGVLRIWDLAKGELRDERMGAPSVATLFFLTDRDLLLSGNVGWTSAFWQVLTLGPEGRVQSVRLLTAPGGTGAVLRDHRTLAILHHDEVNTKTWISLWDIQTNALIHRWELNVPCDSLLAIPGTRDVLVYDRYSTLRRYSLNCPPGEPQVLFDAESIAAGVEIRLCAEAEDPEGGPLAFAWDLGDGTTGEGACVTHAYATAGTYTIQVTARDDAGGASSRVVQVEVPAGIRLYADFAWLPSEPWVREEVVFLDRSRPEGAIARRVWNFGDGSSAEGREVSHTYAKPGTYSVTLTIYSADGREEQTENTVIVADVSYIEAIPSPGGPPFYKVRLTSEDRAMISFGGEVQIVRRPEAPEVGEPVLVATGRVVLLEDTVAWISILVTAEGREPRVGDRVIPVKPVARTEPQEGLTPPSGTEPPEAPGQEEKPPEGLAQVVCGEDAEAVRARLGASVEEDLAALTAGLSSQCVETRLDFIDLVREMAQTGLAKPLGMGLLPMLAKLLKEDSEPRVRIRSILALRDLGLPAEDVVPPLVEALRTDGDAEVRETAARTLGRICHKSGYTSPELMEALREALQDENAQVRGEASNALSLLLPQEEADIPRLIALLSDPSPEVRANAALALGRYGEKAVEAIPSLLDATGDEDARVRYFAWGAISTVKNVGEEVVPYILQGLKDPDEQVRGMVIFLIQTLLITRAEVIESLVQLSEHQSWGHRLHVIQALDYLIFVVGPINGKVMAALIARLFLDPHPLVRMEAAQALARLAQSKPAALEALIEALGDEHPFVGLTAAIGMGQLSGVSASKAVVPLLRLLERVTAPDAPQWPSIEELLSFPESGEELRTIIVCECPEPISALSGGGGFFVVIPKLDESVDIIDKALAKVGPPPAEDLPQLVELLQAKSAEVRLRTVRAIAALGKEALPALEALKRVAAGDEDPLVREEAESAVTNLERLISQVTSPPENKEELWQMAVQALRKAAEDPDPWVATSATQALAQIEPPPEKPILERLTSEDRSQRAAALEELARLDPMEKEALLEKVLALSDWMVKLDIVEAFPSLQVAEEKAISLLLPIVGNQEEAPIVRCAAAEALWRIDPKSKRLAEELIRVLREVHEANVFIPNFITCLDEVLVAMGQNALDSLLDALVQSDTKGLYGVASPIAAFGSEALGRLFHLAEEGKLGDRSLEIAARAVAQMSPPPLQEVVDELRSPSESRRLLAVQVLSEWTKEASLFKDLSERGYKVEMDVPDVDFISEALHIALRDNSPSVRGLALNALKALAPYPQVAIDPLSVAKFLEDQNPDMRVRAIYVLGVLGERASGAAPDLIPILQDQEAIMRVYAAWALARMGVEVDQAVEVLIEGLFDEHPGVVLQAVWALGELGPAAEPAVPFLLTLLRVQPLGGMNPEYLITWIKEMAITALGKIRTSSPEVIQELVRFTRHENPVTRKAAAEALGMLSAPEAKEALIALLQDPEDLVREAAVKALANLKDEGNVDLFLDCLDDQSVSVRAVAARALASFPEQGSRILPELIRALPDLPKRWPDQTSPLCAFGEQALAKVSDFLPTARFIKEREAVTRALQQLAECFGEKTVPLLLEALRHPASEIRKVAISTLHRMGIEVVPKLTEGLRDPGLRNRVKEVLIGMGKDVLPYVEDLLWTGEKDVRVAAMDVVVQVDVLVALPLLFELVQDEDPAIRKAAVWGLAQAGPAAAPALPVLMKMLDDPEMQIPVLNALGAIGPQAHEAIPKVRGLLGALNLRIRCEAASALAKMGANDEETIAALIGALRDTNSLVREEAKDALAALAPASVPALVEAFRSDDLLLQSGAESALAEIGPDPLLLSLLEKELAFGSPRRVATALLLSRFGEAGRDALPVLVEILILSKEDQNLYESAIAALGRLGPAALPAVPLILEALEHQSARVRRTAAQALGQIFAQKKAVP